MAFDKLKGFMDQAKNAAVQHLGQDTIDDAKSKLDKLKDLMGNAMDDAKDVAVEHLGQETVDEAICAMGKLKDLVGDTVHSAVEYLEQDSVERAIAKRERKLEWEKANAPKMEAKKLAQQAAAEEAKKREKLRKAAELLAGDFDVENKDDLFFINHNYDEPYTQSEWAELYRKLKAEKDPQALVPMYNAVAVNSEGYFRRRGLYLGKDYFRIDDFLGHGDKIEPENAIDPYTYRKRPRFEENRMSDALRKKYHWENAYEKEMRKIRLPSGASSGSYSGASMGSGPAPSRGLSSTEKAELDRAKRKYEDAVARASYHRGDKVKTSVYDDAEKRAHAEYMRVLAKYSGRG